MAQSFASGIPATNGVAQPSTCDTNTLETSTGPVQLRAEFTPEVINLRWYNDDARINVPTASSTCTYDTAISLPPNPTKPGYKFAGWEVLQYDFSTIDTSIDARAYYGHDIDISNDSSVCWKNGGAVTCDATFADLGRHQWKASFTYGIIYGDAMCSGVPGTHAVAGNPINDGGKYCWCKATGYKNNDIWYNPTSNLSWVLENIATIASDCENFCARWCGVGVMYNAEYRRAVFGQSGN